jgi:hypothetical protein
MATLPSGGKKTFLPPALIPSTAILWKLFVLATHRSLLLKRQSSQMHNAKERRSLHIAYISRFAGNTVAFREKKMRKEIICYMAHLVSLIICKIVHQCSSFVFT